MAEMKCKTCKSNCVWVGKEMAEHGKCLVGYTPITNADRIRAMTDEELAEFLDKWEAKDIDYSLTFCNMCKGEMYDCHKDCLMQWLKKEVEDG